MTKHVDDLRPVSRKQRQPPVSTFSILILSGFLIEAAITRFVTGNLQVYAMYAGVLGLLAFIGLDQVKNLRRRRAEVAGQRYVEGRLTRHVDRYTTPAEGAAAQ